MHRTYNTRNSSLPWKHSAKPLPSVTLDKRHSAYTESANVSLASVFLSGTRQRLCRVLNRLSAKKKAGTRQIGLFAECHIPTLGKVASLPSVTLGKDLFIECYTRQRCHIDWKNKPRWCKWVLNCISYYCMWPCHVLYFPRTNKVNVHTQDYQKYISLNSIMLKDRKKRKSLHTIYSPL